MALCQSCNYKPISDDDLREHYSSRYHNYNLSRRIDDLAPVSLKTFEAYLKHIETEKEKQTQVTGPTIYICDACSKKFSSEGQFEAHIKSKKHIQNVKALLAAQKSMKASESTQMEVARQNSEQNTTSRSESSVVITKNEMDETPLDDEDGDLENDEEGTVALTVDSNNCLFCFEKSEGIEENMRHMRLKHSFYIPDIEFLVEPVGLIEHLLEKIASGRCIYCTGNKVYESAQAVQQHMIDKQHCKMVYEELDDLDEYADFYEYVYEDEEEEGGENSKGNYRDVISSSYAPGTITPSGDLQLPGNKVAHPRQLLRYYKQHFRLPDTRSSVAIHSANLALEYRANGITTVSQFARQRASIQRGNNTNVAAQKYQQRKHQRFQLLIGVSYNKIMRKHFHQRVLE
jgi:pre-60S factor REI1